MNSMDIQRMQKRNLEQLKNYRLLDDDFMTVIFKNSDCAELLLRIVLNKPDIRVIDVQTQDYFKNLEGRSAILDIYAIDDEGVHYDIEVQRSDKGAVMKRARYNGSLMDANITEPGEEYEKLPDVYVIFITESDVLGAGLPLYHYCNTCMETGKIANDGKYTVYVNSQIRDEETDLGKLMHDFWCTDAGQMYYNILAERVRYFKENEEGIQTMCKAMEDRIVAERNEEKVNNTVEIMKNLMETMKWTVDQTLKAMNIPESDYGIYKNRV